MKTVEDIELIFPRTLTDAVRNQADEKTRAQPLAGGTDLMVQWASGAAPIPERALSLWHLDELRQIRETPTMIEIGALATHAMIHASPLVHKHLPALAAAAGTIGGPQIQARGTIAGNVANASPAGDLAPALLVTGGAVILASRAGEREEPLTKFFLGYRRLDMRPDELIVRFVLPKRPAHLFEFFHKLGARRAQAISKVMGACRALINQGRIENIAIALGSVAPVPIRLFELEQTLAGKKLSREVIALAEKTTSDLVRPIDDIRSTAEYRKWVSGRLVRRFLEQLAAHS